MKKTILTIAMTLSSLISFAQEQNQIITMEMVPTYTIDVTETQINIATTYPIDVYVDDVIYSIIVPGFHTLFIAVGTSRVMVLPHEQY